MLFQRLAFGRLDSVCSDQRHNHWVPGSLIHGFVAGRGAGDIGRVRGAVILKSDAVMCQECYALHKAASLATVQIRSDCTASHSTVILVASCSDLPSEERNFRIGDRRIVVSPSTGYTLEIAPEAKFANLNHRS